MEIPQEESLDYDEESLSHDDMSPGSHSEDFDDDDEFFDNDNADQGKLIYSEDQAFESDSDDSSLGDGVFEYNPLVPMDASFRLLKLLRREEGQSSTPRCELLHKEFDGEHPSLQYEALSYTWGTYEKNFKILIDGRYARVTVNLFDALTHLRLRNTDRLLWIDAICINQGNNDEKSHQVRKMGQIYKRAEKVVIWLGQGSTEKDSFFAFLEQVESIGYLSSNFPNNWKNEARIGLESLLNHSWFERVWVIQEVAQSRSAVITCGYRSTPAEIFAQAPILLGVTPNEHCRQILAIMSGTGKEPQLDDAGRGNERSWNHRDLRTLLLQFNKSCSKDPKDKVYALYGLSKEHKDDTFVLDYDKSESSVVHDTIASMFPSLPADHMPYWSLSYFWKTLSSLNNTFLIWAAKRGHDDVVKLLLATEGIDVDWTNPEGETALYEAAERGYAKVVELLLETERVDINRSYLHGQCTPLEAAARYFHGPVIQLLLRRKNVIVETDTVQDALVECVARYDDPRFTQYYRNRYDYRRKEQLRNREEQETLLKAVIDAGLFNLKSSRGKSLLSYVLECRNDTAAKLLLEMEDIVTHSLDKDGRTPLSWAAQYGFAEIAKLLLARSGTEVNSRDHTGRTPLSWAAQNTDTETLKVLVAHEGVEVDTRDGKGRTPLSRAAQYGKMEVAELLLSQRGVNVNSQDQDGDTPLNLAVLSYNLEMTKLLLAQDELQVNSQNHRRCTALLDAMRDGCWEQSKLLLARKDIDVNIEDQNGNTALGWAMHHDDQEMIELLLAQDRLQVNSQNHEGRTSLIDATRKAHLEHFKLLLARKDIDVNIEDQDGNTALGWAMHRDNQEMIELLLAKGGVRSTAEIECE